MTREPGAVGDVVAGRFELRQRLGSGSMGTVWRAHDPVLDRDVAVKEMRPGRHEDRGRVAHMRERAIREAKALARLNHPHAVTIHELVDGHPYPWLVMEFVAGVPLSDLLHERTLTPAQAACTGLDVLAALRAAHAAGVLHRDVKPANVLIRPDGRAVLTDFGIADLRDALDLTATGDLIGSPDYLAPERIRPEAATVGPASDLWSLGVLLYMCVEGTNPMRRDSLWETLVAIREDPPPPMRRAGPLAPLVGALLSKEPEARPTAEEAARTLSAVGDGRPYRPDPDGSDPEEGSGRRPAASTVRTPPPSTATADGRDAAAESRTTGPTARRSRTSGIAHLRVPGVLGALVLAAAVAVAVALYAARQGPSAPASGTAGPSTTPLVSVSATPSATGLWIAQLAAIPHASTPESRSRELLALQRDIPGAKLLNSDDWRSLQPGYWVIYATGTFQDGDAALAFCARHGRARCIGRYLSQDAGDSRFICLPRTGTPAPEPDPEGCRRP
ncbi:protein kinase [Streptomyces sp. BE20]|uniref:serine/threonine-protein kinase n=1 Tax=unclassified Streptomyces TaxID=2593676 RepID=UPI002E772353|nr:MULTISPECIES: protein kinase [unclassified Streptomyces]MED7947381.1 protein kinase [Streptomyces sp. BE303]MEE1827363.1 protein kinase [Streptomyces sp. BE20]